MSHSTSATRTARELTRKAVEQIEQQVESAGEARRIRAALLETSAIA
jgi:hypothetical protein